MGTALIAATSHRRPPRGRARRPEPAASAPEQTDDAPTPDTSLEDALRRAREGDESGFVELWRELHPRLLRYLRVRSQGNHDDVAAETWLQAVRDLPSFIGNADGFRAWLFTLARHRAIDAARATAARPQLSIPDFTAVGRTPTAPAAETEAMERMSTERALKLVKRLPPEQADMVMLRVVAGLDVPVVAEIVGKSPGAVRVSVHRGLRALARDPHLNSEVV